MNAEQLPAKKLWKRVGGVLTCLFVAWLVIGLPDAIRAHRSKSEWLAAARALQSLPRDLSQIIDEFRDAQQKAEKLLPSEVTLQELVTAGKLKSTDIAGLAGYQAFVSLQSDETMPNSVLVRVVGRDNRQMVLLTDGSIMTLPRKQ